MFPKQISLYITTHCTLRCKHCFLLQKGDLNKHELSLSYIIPMLDELAYHKVFMISINGGDPLLHPDLIQIIKEIRKRNILPLMGITGVAISENLANHLFEAGLRCIQVSLDGIDEESNAIFRGKGFFDEILNGITILQNAGIKVNIATIINKNNYMKFFMFLNLAKNIGAFKVKAQSYFSFNTEPMLELSSKELDEVRIVIENFEKLNKLTDWVALTHMTSKKNNILLDIYRDSIIVKADGSVVKHEFIDKSIGNIKHSTIENMLKKCYNEYIPQI